MNPGQDIALADHLLSGLALFGLKYPSLLQFERDRREATTRANLLGDVDLLQSA